MPSPLRPRQRTAVVVVAAAFALTFSAGAAPGETLDECERRVRARPEAQEEYLCFHTFARASGEWEAAEKRLAELAPALPFPGWALLVRGHLTQLRDEPRSIDLYRQAVTSFAGAGMARGEILARHNLRNLLHRRGETKAAATEVAAALAAAERSGEPLLQAQALVLRGTHLVETGGDLALAHHDLRRALELLPADASYPQRKLALLALANAAFQLGRYDDAVGTYERLLELTRAQNDAAEEATALFNIANARQRQYEERPRASSLVELEALAGAALEAAVRAKNRQVEIRAAALLAQVERGLGRSTEARRRIESALAVARDVGHPERIMICLWILAGFLAEDEPAAARSRIDEATALALATGNDRHLVHAWRAHLRLDWRTPSRQDALSSARRALGAIEALAARQGDEAATVGLFGAWARDYRWLAGQLLDPEARDVAAAFAVMERMRARALLAAIDSTAAVGGGPTGAHLEAPVPDGGVERDLQREIIQAQRRLLAPDLDPGAVDELMRELEQRELALAAARAARLHDAGTRADPLTFARLDELRAALRPDEALLLYQLAPLRDLYGDPAGGSWLLGVTAGGTSVHRLPDPAAIEPLVPLFLGLVDRRDGSERAAAARLGELLLAPALDSLPPGTRRLIVVPDGALHTLPFELLRAGGDAAGTPVGARFELAVVPSATALLHWRSANAAPPLRSALIIADPELAFEAPRGPELATEPPAVPTLAGLAPLGGARREGRWLERRLRPSSELLLGAAATESALARTDLGSFAILHIAAHAVAESLQPQRSAVFLSPANAGEDGLLQAREIVRLPLAGRLVVLPACRSAAGAVGEGEGPLSLARAFQQAGARAVVASRWPLRDDEAEEVVRRLYRRLAAGGTLGSAMRATRSEAAADGLAAAAWGSFVLMGDAELEPLAGVEISTSPLPWIAIVSLLLAGLGLAITRLRRRG
jgi:CHAT domain-containing protein/tetratricopeptide (TPR) repeat protein